MIKHKRFDSLTIQLSEIDEKTVLYEEIDNNTDFVIYSHTMSIENVKKLYPWFF